MSAHDEDPDESGAESQESWLAPDEDSQWFWMWKITTQVIAHVEDPVKITHQELRKVFSTYLRTQDTTIQQHLLRTMEYDNYMSETKYVVIEMEVIKKNKMKEKCQRHLLRKWLSPLTCLEPLIAVFRKVVATEYGVARSPEGMAMFRKCFFDHYVCEEVRT